MKLSTLTENPNWVKMHTTRKGHKKMYKAKKQWIVASIAMLGFGGTVLAGTVTHASSVQNPKVTVNNNLRLNAKSNTSDTIDSNNSNNTDNETNNGRISRISNINNKARNLTTSLLSKSFNNKIKGSNQNSGSSLNKLNESLKNNINNKNANDVNSRDDNNINRNKNGANSLNRANINSNSSGDNLVRTSSKAILGRVKANDKIVNNNNNNINKNKVSNDLIHNSPFINLDDDWHSRIIPVHSDNQAPSNPATQTISDLSSMPVMFDGTNAIKPINTFYPGGEMNGYHAATGADFGGYSAPTVDGIGGRAFDGISDNQYDPITYRGGSAEPGVSTGPYTYGSYHFPVYDVYIPKGISSSDYKDMWFYGRLFGGDGGSCSYINKRILGQNDYYDRYSPKVWFTGADVGIDSKQSLPSLLDTDTLKYVTQSGTSVGTSGSMQGIPGLPIVVGSNPPGLDTSNWSVVNPGQSFSYSNKTHTVLVASTKASYEVQFTYKGSPMGSDNLGNQHIGYSTTVSSVQGDIPSGYTLANGVTGSSPISFSKQGSAYVGTVPIKKKTYNDYGIFSDASDGYTSSKFSIGSHPSDFTFNMNPSYDSNLSTDYKLVNPNFSESESNSGSVTVHIPVTRKVYAEQLPVDINLESDGIINGLPASKRTTKTVTFNLKVKGPNPSSDTDKRINLIGSSDADFSGKEFMQPHYTVSKDHTDDDSYDVTVQPNSGGKTQISPNPDGDNKTIEFYETPKIDHLNTVYVNSDGTQIPNSHQSRINGDETTTMDPRDAYRDRLDDGGSDIPNGYYLILDKEYAPETLFSPSSGSTTVDIYVEPRAIHGTQPVIVNLEGPNGKQVHSTVPWNGVPGKDSVTFNASDYTRPYNAHYTLDTSQNTSYTGNIIGNNDLTFSNPSLIDGSVQFYMKPIMRNMNTCYEDIDTGSIVPGTSAKSLTAPDGTVITPAKAMTMRGDGVPAGYQLVPNQDSQYTFNADSGSTMLDIRVEPREATGKTITVNRFIRSGNAPFKADGTISAPLSKLTYTKNGSTRISPSDYVPNGYEVDNSKDNGSDNAVVYPKLNKDGSITPSSINYYYRADPTSLHVVYKTSDGHIVGSDPDNIDGSLGQQIKQSDIDSKGSVTGHVPTGYTINPSQANTTYTIGDKVNIADVYVNGVAGSGTFNVYLKFKYYPNNLDDYKNSQPKLVDQIHKSGNYGKLLSNNVVKVSDYLGDVPKGYVQDPNSNNSDVTLYINKNGKLAPIPNSITYHFVAGYSGSDPDVKPATINFVNAVTHQPVGKSYIANGYMDQTKTVSDMVNSDQVPNGYELLPNSEQSQKSYTFSTKPGTVDALVEAKPLTGTFTITRWLEHSDKSITKIDTIKKQLLISPGQSRKTYTFDAQDLIPNKNLQVDPNQEDDNAPVTTYIDQQGNVRPKNSANFYYQNIPAKPVTVKYYDIDNGNPLGNQVTINGHQGEVRPVINIARKAYPEANVPSDYSLASAKSGQSPLYHFGNEDGVIDAYVKNYPTRISIPRFLEFPDGETRKADADAEIVTQLDKGKHKVYYADQFTPFGYETDPHKPSAVAVTKSNDGSLVETPSAFYYKAMQSNQSDSPVNPIKVNYIAPNGNVITSKRIDGFMGEPMSAKVEDSVPDNYEINGGQDLSRVFNQYRNTPVDIKVSPKPVNTTDETNSDTEIDHSTSDQPTILSDNYIPEQDASDSVSASRGRTKTVHESASQGYHHYRWFWITRPLQMYTSSKMSRHSRKGMIMPKQKLTVRILHIYRHKHGKLTYKIRYRGHVRYVNGRLASNAYYSEHDLRHASKRKVHYIRIRARYDFMHVQTKFRHLVRARRVHRGQVLRVIGIKHIGPKYGGMTRFVLSNGRYVTANKNYVKLIK